MHRNSSAARFKLINGNNFLQLLNASFYKVTTRTIDGPVYLVAVFHNGSFAYTDPYFANHELHLPQIMSLFIAGNISINALFYYHPWYLQAFGKKISISDASLVSVTVDVSHIHDRVDVTENNAWNYAHRFTETEWKELGLGGIAYDNITHSTVKAIRDHPDSIGVLCKKIHKI